MNPQGKQGQQRENEQMLQIIKEAFRNCSQNGAVSKDKFNQALSILEALGFKRLRDTPLADRLFHIFEKCLIITGVQLIAFSRSPMMSLMPLMNSLSWMNPLPC